MTTTAGSDVHERLTALAERQIAAGEVRGAAAVDTVNLPMIRHWVDAMGDANPVYTDADLAAGTVHGEIVAPPAMIQVWTMAGVKGEMGPGPITPVLDMLDAEGFTGVVATNCEQTYHRYLRLGERVEPSTRLTGLSGPKTTALGAGYFVTWMITWYVSEEPVAEMMFRVLKFRPWEEKPAPGKRDPYPLRPAVNRDTAFFWEGATEGELRIQKCGDCGKLRHPPGPFCPSCRSLNRTYVVAAGAGEVFSFVVHHNPPVPGPRAPFVVAVVALPEGVRIVGNIIDCPPEQVTIGMPVQVTYRDMDDDLTLPMWAPREV
ncbi:bifunctional MaoC family dehydratase N-terminal/OB-fold nucleic acid binding domain-containing protein [Sphaerisporangium sp. B11E5]|uniref:bifunctional MaoC family dehydratase N-terminal/OB-fold nucleic acid binding domain-containing protein n=1 Tax=Sphaerisporangium sp. B11E5 TaxID=3153563 RepID=UPI00325CE290